jgi:hypothetical protein
MTPSLNLLSPPLTAFLDPRLQNLELGRWHIDIDSLLNLPTGSTNVLDLDKLIAILLLVDRRVIDTGQRGKLSIDDGVLEPVKCGRDLGRVGRRRRGRSGGRFDLG